MDNDDKFDWSRLSMWFVIFSTCGLRTNGWNVVGKPTKNMKRIALRSVSVG